MLELIGLVALGTFGAIAVIAEREPQSENKSKKLTRRSIHSDRRP